MVYSGARSKLMSSKNQILLKVEKFVLFCQNQVNNSPIVKRLQLKTVILSGDQPVTP